MALVPYTLPPNTQQAYGGDPAGDANAMLNALAALGASNTVLSKGFNGGADPTGATASDAAFAAAALVGGQLVVPPGTYLMNGAAAVSLAVAGTKLIGCGTDVTKIKIGGSFTGPQAFAIIADACTIADLSIVGNSSTVTSNPVANAIEITGSQRAKVRDVFFQYINGWAIEAVGSASRGCLDLMIRNIVGRNCAGGVHCLGVTGSNFLGEYFLTDIQLQQMGAATGGSANLDALLIEDISDVLAQGVNIGCASGTIGGVIHVKGACSTVRLTNLDVGAQSASGVAPSIFIESGSNGTPNDIQVTASRCGGGGVGTRVDAGTSILLNGLHIHQAYGTGLVINGGEVECVAVNLAANNQSGGTGFDIDQSGMGGGNARFFGCRAQTSSGSGAGLVTNPVSANSRGYYDSCYFIGGGTQTPSTVFTGTPQRIKNCVGYNPRGSITAPTITASPFSSNTSQQDVLIIFTAINSLTAFKIGGTSTSVLPVNGQSYFVPARQSLELDYSGATPTWQWYGC